MFEDFKKTLDGFFKGKKAGIQTTNLKSRRHVLVIGGSGIGKTFLLKKFCTETSFNPMIPLIVASNRGEGEWMDIAEKGEVEITSYRNLENADLMLQKMENRLTIFDDALHLSEIQVASLETILGEARKYGVQVILSLQEYPRWMKNTSLHTFFSALVVFGVRGGLRDLLAKIYPIRWFGSFINQLEERILELNHNPYTFIASETCMEKTGEGIELRVTDEMRNTDTASFKAILDNPIPIRELLVKEIKQVKEKQTPTPYKYTHSKMQQVLDILKENPRTPYREVAERTRLAPSTVSIYAMRLKRKGLLPPEKLGDRRKPKRRSQGPDITIAHQLLPAKEIGV